VSAEPIYEREPESVHADDVDPSRIEPWPFEAPNTNGFHIVERAASAELVLTAIEDFAAADEAGAEALAHSAGDGGTVIAPGGLVIVYGDGGAGKTTLVNDLAFALATGNGWLDLVLPDRPLRVLMIENEGPRQEFRKKLERKLAATGAQLNGRISVLEEPWAEFNFKLEAHRIAIAEAIDNGEIDLLVVGPLASVGAEGGGTPEDIEKFNKLLGDVRHRCARSFAALLVHHENRAGQISGAWERVPDTLIHVSGQGNGRTRLYWQKARWSSALHETSTQLNWADGESYTIETRPEVTEDSMETEMLDATRARPGESWTKIREHVTGKAIDAAKVRDRLIAQELLINGAAQEGRFNLWHHEDPSAPRSLPGTARERATDAPPAEASEHVTVPRSPSKEERRNGNGHDAAEVAPNQNAHDDIAF
jgi:hypothetical protein